MERAQRANSETGTGFACGAKLSEVLPPVANAPVVRMTQKREAVRELPFLPLALLASSG